MDEQWMTDYENAFGKNWRQRLEADMDGAYSQDEQLGHYDWEWVEEVPIDEDQYEESGYYPCGCPFCMCWREVEGGGVCSECQEGACQG